MGFAVKLKICGRAVICGKGEIVVKREITIAETCNSDITSKEWMGDRKRGIYTLRFAIAKSHQRTSIGKQTKGANHLRLRFPTAISRWRGSGWIEGRFVRSKEGH